MSIKLPSFHNKTICANYAGIIVQFLAPIISLPFYLSLLGPSQFGLVSFITTIQTTLGLLEAGFAQVSTRDFAILTNKYNPDYSSAAYYLSRFERIFWGLSIAVAVLTACTSGYIVDHWLNVSTNTIKSLSVTAVIGAAFIFAVQYPSALYRSYLAGSEQQVKLSLINSTAAIARNLFGIIALTIHPSLYIYIACQILCYALETIVRRIASWKSINCIPVHTTEKKNLFTKAIKDSLGMFVAVLLGSITTQLDKIFLSSALPIEQFGYYSIASTVSLGVIASIQPVVLAISPSMMQSANNKEALKLQSLRLAKMIAIVIIAFAVIYILLGHVFLKIWLQDTKAVDYVFPLLSILLIGSGLNAFYHIGYYNWIARGKTRRIFIVNLLSFLITISFTPILIKYEGARGATFGFVVMNLLGLILSSGWVKSTQIQSAKQ